MGRNFAAFGRWPAKAAFLFALAPLAGFLLPSSASATQAVMVYFSSGSNAPAYATSPAAGFDGTETQLSAVNIGELPARWYRVKNAPNKGEIMLIGQGQSNWITPQFFNGVVWSTTTDATASTGAFNINLTNVRGWDFAYFQNDGNSRGLLVYRPSGSGLLRYRIWFSTASRWSTENTAPNFPSDTYRWIRVEPKPNTNKILVVANENTDRLMAQAYNLDTDAWSDFIILDTSCTWADTNGTDARPFFDVAFEQTSGQGLVVWTSTTDAASPASDTFIRFAEWNDPGWTGPSSATAFGLGDGNNGRGGAPLRLAARPGSNEITCAVAVDAINRLSALIWDGAAWVSSETIHEQLNGIKPRLFDVAYERGSGDCLIVYQDGLDGAPKFRTRPAGSLAWAAQGVVAWTGAGAGNWVQLFSENDSASDLIYLIAQSTQSPATLIYNRWSGSAWGAPVTRAADTARDHEAFGLAYLVDGSPPAGISDLTGLAEAEDGKVRLSWTSPGDDGITGNLTGLFRVKVSTQGPILSGEFDAPASTRDLRTVDVSTANHVALNPFTTSFVLTGLAGNDGRTLNIRTWFAVKARDDSNNFSVWNSSIDAPGVNTASTATITITPPGAVTGVGGVKFVQNQNDDISLGDAQVRLNWTVPGDDGWTGNNTAGLVRVVWTRNGPISDTATFNSLFTGGGSSTTFTTSVSSAVGSSFSILLDTATVPGGLAPNATYWFAIRVRDEYDLNFSSWPGVALGITSATAVARPPANISDITGLAGTNDGSIGLMWTNPGDDGTAGNITGGKFIVLYSTQGPIRSGEFGIAGDDFSVVVATRDIRVASSSTPATIAPLTVSTITFTVTGLGPGGHPVWFAVRMRDEVAGNYSVWNSSIDAPGVNAASTATISVVPPAQVSDLTALRVDDAAIRLEWTSPGDDGTAGAISVGGRFQIAHSTFGVIPSTGPGFDFNTISATFTFTLLDNPTNYSTQGTIHNHLLTGLVPNAAYWFGIKVKDEYANNWANWQTTVTAGAGINSASTAAATVIPPAPVSNLTALAGSGSGEVILQWTSPGDDGTVGVLPSRGTALFRIRFSSVAPVSSGDFDNAAMFATNGGSLAVHGGGIDWPAVDITTSGVAPGTPLTFVVTGLTPGLRYWFAIRTRDEVNDPVAFAIWNSSVNVPGVNTAANAPAGTGPPPVLAVEVEKTIGQAGGKVSTITANGLLVELDFPADAVFADTVIKIRQLVRGATDFPKAGPGSPHVDLAISTWPVVGYNFTADGKDHARFRKPFTMKLGYPDADNNGRDDVLGEPLAKAETGLRIFFWDGAAYRFVGGTVDAANNRITARADHFTPYAILPSKAGPTPEATTRIITPFTVDGFNDRITFAASSGISRFEVYDITGKRVRRAEDGSNTWNGRDDNGNPVETGLYLWKAWAVDGNTQTGAVYVAR